MERDEWMDRYLREIQRLGPLTEEDAKKDRRDQVTDKLLQDFAYDPEGAAIYVARFTSKKCFQ